MRKNWEMVEDLLDLLFDNFLLLLKAIKIGQR